MDIRLAESDEDVRACFPVMRELRPHLDGSEFLRRIRTQQAEGYTLAALTESGTVQAVAGFRVIQNLASGRVLYVDDLVTAEASRGRRYGAALLEWLVDRARRLECDVFSLDSGVQRFDAHRFYFRHRMHVSSYHFKRALLGDEASIRREG